MIATFERLISIPNSRRSHRARSSSLVVAKVAQKTSSASRGLSVCSRDGRQESSRLADVGFKDGKSGPGSKVFCFMPVIARMVDPHQVQAIWHPLGAGSIRLVKADKATFSCRTLPADGDSCSTGRAGHCDPSRPNRPDGRRSSRPGHGVRFRAGSLVPQKVHGVGLHKAWHRVDACRMIWQRRSRNPRAIPTVAVSVCRAWAGAFWSRCSFRVSFGPDRPNNPISSTEQMADSICLAQGSVHRTGFRRTRISAPVHERGKTLDGSASP